MNATPNAAQLEVESNTIFVAGKIYFENVMSIFEKGLRLFNNMDNIVINLNRVEHCDSSLLTLCSAWVRATKEKNKSIAFLEPPKFVEDLIKAHDLNKVLPGMEISE